MDGKVFLLSKRRTGKKGHRKVIFPIHKKGGHFVLCISTHDLNNKMSKHYKKELNDRTQHIMFMGIDKMSICFKINFLCDHGHAY